ncbi:hemolysin family protein [Massilia sp. PAMC28688]|uniref:hemolysin family protein n=1 Tax=Massilia sp. PAMC28688 TaxID=2861283 RepID=UPI001C632C30|nr:hemolysin family protein [Massilia sp. PAMC28688]QYF94388.1 hemolysin family protein [Massilia sp. PAMC28688]
MSDVLIILLLILLNGLFAMTELALASARRLRLEEAARGGSTGAAAALALAANPSTFLSTVQVGITLISIFNGAFGQSSLAARLAPWLATVPVLGPYAPAVALGVVIVAITFVSLLLGELVPKRIAMQYPETAAMIAARPLRLLSRVMAPFVTLLSLCTEAIVRLLGLDRPPDNAPTEQEISGMLREGSDAGVLDHTEYDIARRALRLDSQRLRALMTPLIDVQAIHLGDDAAASLRKLAASPHSRFPVFGTDRTQVVGVVDAGDLLQQAIESGALHTVDIGAASAAPMRVPASMSARALLEQFQQHNAELALVIDEHGQVQGMVTLADLMGALLGGVPGAAAHESEAVVREDGSWLVDGAMPLDRLRELLGTDAAFPGEGTGFHTLAGLVLHQLGRVPTESDAFEWNGYRFEVMDMDRQRVDRVLVAAPQDAART